MERTPYPSDLTDEQWAILAPLLPSRRPLGRPRKTNLRDIVDAILYRNRNRNGCTWRALPHDLPFLPTARILDFSTMRESPPQPARCESLAEAGKSRQSWPAIALLTSTPRVAR